MTPLPTEPTSLVYAQSAVIILISFLMTVNAPFGPVRNLMPEAFDRSEDNVQNIRTGCVSISWLIRWVVMILLWVTFGFMCNYTGNIPDDQSMYSPTIPIDLNRTKEFVVYIQIQSGAFNGIATLFLLYRFTSDVVYRKYVKKMIQDSSYQRKQTLDQYIIVLKNFLQIAKDADKKFAEERVKRYGGKVGDYLEIVEPERVSLFEKRFQQDGRSINLDVDNVLKNQEDLREQSKQIKMNGTVPGNKVLSIGLAHSQNDIIDELDNVSEEINGLDIVPFYSTKSGMVSHAFNFLILMLFSATIINNILYVSGVYKPAGTESDSLLVDYQYLFMVLGGFLVLALFGGAFVSSLIAMDVFDEEQTKNNFFILNFFQWRGNSLDGQDNYPIGVDHRNVLGMYDGSVALIPVDSWVLFLFFLHYMYVSVYLFRTDIMVLGYFISVMLISFVLCNMHGTIKSFLEYFTWTSVIF